MIKKFSNNSWGELTGKKYHISKNLFNGELVNGYYNNSEMEINAGGVAGVYKSFSIYLKAGTYTFGWSKPINVVRQVRENNTYEENLATDVTSWTITTDYDCLVGISFRDATSSSTIWDNSPIMANEGSSALPYEPYGDSWKELSTKPKVYQRGQWVTPIIYGWHVDPSISDSSNAVTYLEEAVGKTPAAMGSSTFDYGSWENAFFMPKPCMLRSDGTVAYYLNPNDYTKKADGTASDVANENFDGNAMMEWPLIWYKFEGTETDGEGYFYVSDQKVDDTYHCWCNIDSQNNITPHFYTAIYNGTGTTKLRSISGVALTGANGNGYTTASQEVERALANNTTNSVEWYTDVWCDRLLINALLVLVGKSLNSQATFGLGFGDGTQADKERYVTGSLDDKGLFYGDISNRTSGVKVFGMENWWGCAWHRTAGCITVDNAVKIKLTYGTADGSTTVGYNATGDNYIDNGVITAANNNLKTLRYNEYGFIVSTTGTVVGYYADFCYPREGTRYLNVGGYSGNGASGTFYLNFYYAESSNNWYLSTALSCKPLAN